MEFINAKEAAKIANAAREQIALARTVFAQNYVKEEIMPYIAEEASYGRNASILRVALDSDAYRVREFIISTLKELGYDVKFREGNGEFVIKW